MTGCVGGEPTGESNTTDRIPATSVAPASSSTTPPPPSTAPDGTTAPSIGAVTCEPPAPEPGAEGVMVTIYEICDATSGMGDRVLAGLVPVERMSAATVAPLRSALEALLAGPTPEESAAGLSSWFSTSTADTLIGLSLDEGGLAMIDLDGDTIAGIDNVSTTTGGDFFRGQLYGTAFALEEISGVGFSLDGSTSAFCAMMELIPDCTPIARAEWDEILSQTSG